MNPADLPEDLQYVRTRTIAEMRSAVLSVEPEGVPDSAWDLIWEEWGGHAGEYFSARALYRGPGTAALIAGSWALDDETAPQIDLVWLSPLELEALALALTKVDA